MSKTRFLFNKLLLSFAALVVGFAANATEVTYDVTKQGFKNKEEILTPGRAGGVSLFFSKGYYLNYGPTYYSSGNAVRLYSGNMLTITPPAGNAISKVVFTFGPDDGKNEITADRGTFVSPTWTGWASEIIFIVQGMSGHRSIQKITITFSPGVGTDQSNIPPPGEGTKENPYTPDQLREKYFEAPEGIVYVKGYIVGSLPSSLISKPVFGTDNASTTNMLIAPMAISINPDICAPVQLPTNRGVRDALNLADNPGNLGKQVILAGTLRKYCGAMGVNSTSYYEFIGEDAGSNPGGAVNPNPGTVYTVAQALAMIPNVNDKVENATVTGYISKIDEISTSYGNATYYIVDNLSNTTSPLEVYRGYSLDGKQFTSATEIAVGGKVTVNGTLTNYNGTKEFNSGSKILSYEAPNGGGNNPGGGDTDSNSVTFNFADIASLNPVPAVTEGAGEYDVTDVKFREGRITFTGTATADAANKPRLFLSTGAWTYRFYQNNTITIAADEGVIIKKMTFQASNLGNTSITWSAGTFNSNTWTPEPDSTGETSIVLNKTATGSNPSITSATVYYTGISSVANVEVEDANAPVEYYNLQGVRVANPENGLYIRRQGNTATKVLIK